MWWRCGMDIYYTPIMRLITAPTHARDSQSGTREAIFLRLLACCADGHTFADAGQLARFADKPAAQCETVWRICLSEGVLTPSAHGYTAVPWMRAAGMCARIGRRRAQDDDVEKPMDDAEKPMDAKKPKDGPKAAMPNGRIDVRPNVRLSAYELEQLKREFSESDLNALLDHIDEYKRSSGRRYASDMDAIDRWGRKWLRERRAGREVPGWLMEDRHDKD